jgi:hypothetical protein
MNNLTEALREHAGTSSYDPSETESLDLPLARVAKEWANHALDTYSDDLLKKALAVSIALREFADEFNCCTSNSKSR